MKEPHWVPKNFVLSLHEELLAQFGGALGVRDEPLLDAALARPQHLFSYAHPDLFALSAAYMYGIVRNHPFVDGNKRTGFLTGYAFLVRNGKELTVPEPEATAVIMDLAGAKLEEAELAVWLRENSQSR